MNFSGHYTIRSGLIIAILLMSFYTRLEASDTASVRAVLFDTPPRIDGLVNEAIWQTAVPVTEFLQREPDTGEPFTERTEVYIGYDRTHLYVGFRCFGDPGKITAKELARDVSLGYDDRVQVILDTYLDGRNAYWFQIGPRGSIGDAIVSENGAAFNKAWDGLWTGKARIHENGWDAEFAIPFKTMGFKKGADTWGLKLIRYQMSEQETGYWPDANLNTYKFQVSDAGLLTGIGEITQGIGLDIVPYVLTGTNYSQPENRVKPMIDAGFEAYYNITSNLKSAVTVNTDFAQTEVDEQEINLTRFNLFYPEKRDFFLDGANYFNFGINGDRDNPWNTRLIPFFSRRIGLDSAGNQIPLQFGGKITGQAGPWNIGAMYMKDNRGDWANSHFATTRISRNLGTQSQVGFISTYGNALYDTSNLVTGLDLKLGTATFRGNKNMSLILYGLKSFTASSDRGSGSSPGDFAWGGEFLYPNDFLFIRAGHMEIQENFTAGVGFVPRPGVRQTYGELRIGPRPERWGILQVLSGGQVDFISDFDQTLLTRELSLMPFHIRFLSGEEIKLRISHTYEFLDEAFSIFNTHIIPEGDYRFLYGTASVYSAQRRALWGMLDYRFGQFFDGTRSEMKLQAGYKVMVPLFIGGELIRNDIILPEGGFVANIYRLNLNILFSPDITLYNFIQYDNQSGRMGWQSRFQWIIRPGQEVFLVWNSLASDPLERYRTEEATLRLKVKFTLRF